MEKVKKNLKKVLVLILMLPILFLGGCLYAPNPDGSSPYEDGEVNTFKAVYRTENIELDSTLEEYAVFLTKQLYANFGVLNDEGITSALEEESAPDKTANSNYDKIRVQTQVNEINKAVSWNWTFSQNLTDAPSLSVPENAGDYYSSQVVQNAYFEAFVPVYSIAMEIILMQIILDETPAIFAVEINEETNQTKVFADQAKTQELTYGEAQGCEALSLARENFAKKASYVGITQNDKIQLKDYILNSVIGEDIIGGIYDNIIIGGENKTYSLILDEILNINPFQVDENVSGDESQNVKKSIFEPYPLSIVEDLGEKLYTAPAGDMLSHITAREYQSVLVMPSKTNNGFYGFGLALESEYDITIRVSVNYYNSASKKSTIVGQNVVSVKAGEFDAMNMVIINASTNYKVSRLNLSDLSATQPKEINNISGLSEYYDVYDNGWGGIGKLNSDKIGANYFEILLEVQKKLDRDYYPFKFGIVF